MCRHRGARLCDGHKGSVGNIVCPYHQWTYDLSGQLIHTEHMGNDFDKSQIKLKKVHVGNIAGLLFICLADDPPSDFEQMKADMEPYIRPHQIENCKVAYEEDLIENGNWKITMENNRECYHCKANHPELTISLYEFGFGYQPSPDNAADVAAFGELIKKEHSRWESCGLPSVEREFLDSRVTAYRTERLPLDKAGELQTMNSKVACQKLLGELTQRNLGGLSFWTQPNSWHHFMSDHIVTFSVLPIDAGTHAFEDTLARAQGCSRRPRLRSQGLEFRLARHQQTGWRAGRAPAPGRVEPRIFARAILTLYRIVGREVHVLVPATGQGRNWAGQRRKCQLPGRELRAR